MERNYVIKMAKSKMYQSEDQDHPFTAHLDQAKTYEYPELIDLGMNKLIRQAESKYKDYFGNKDYAYVHQISPEELEKDRTDNNEAVPVPALDDPEDEDEDYSLAEMEELFGDNSDDLDDPDGDDSPTTYFIMTVTFKGDPKTYYATLFKSYYYPITVLTPERDNALVYNLQFTAPETQVDYITKLIKANPKTKDKEINLVNFKFLSQEEVKHHYIVQTVKHFIDDLYENMEKDKIDFESFPELFDKLIETLGTIFGDEVLGELQDCLSDYPKDED